MEIEKFKKAISRFKRVAADSACFIYFLEDNPKFCDLAEPIFELAEKNRILVISSVLVLVEVLTGYRRAKDYSAENEFKQMLKDFPAIEIYEVSNKLVNRIVDLRIKYGIKTPDAIHLATAIEHKADVFVTNDRQLTKVKEIAILYLGDYL